MSDNWIVQNLNNALETWNSKMSEIWQLLTQSPETFKGGDIWNVMLTIHDALIGIGYGLLVLFFAVGVVKTCSSYADMKRPEMAVKMFVRFALANGAIGYGLELMMALFNIIQGVVSTIMGSSGMDGSSQALSIPEEMIESIENVGLLDSIPLWIVTLLVEVTLYSVVFMVDYALVARAVLRAERGKAHQAQFRYMKLKQQVNPHFLFNSLNILDCLVCEQRTEQASAYIHKLAGIYRYMLQNEEETLVRLREEMAFVGMYVDLLQVRFPEGFRVETDISDEAMNRHVLPCSVQLLIENAIKHNSVGADRPLVIRIVAGAGAVTVSNNLQLKVSGTTSTRVGLNYIRQQYLDLSGIPIGIRRTDTEYCVTLPLL